MNYDLIIEKMKKNKRLKFEEINYIITNFTNGKISEEEMSTFLMLIYNKGLSYKETLYLTNSMIKSGEFIVFEDLNRIIVDKHSTGGVGDKITLIVSPIVAANGLGVAKMSGRSLGLTGGTIDKLESINGYNVNLNKEEFIKQVNDIGVSVISQTERVAVADKKIYALRDKIGAVDSIPLIASSIMSKKIASGSNVIIIDLKVGKGAFMKDAKSAKKLAKIMIKIGKYWNKSVAVIMTDMNVPLGRSIGNSLEVKETMDFLSGKYRDKRLETLSLTISSYMISLGNNIPLKEAYKNAKRVLDNNEAYDVFKKWIKSQGGNPNNLKEKASTFEVISDKNGFINNIDAEKLAEICSEIGVNRTDKRTEVDYAAGIVLNKTINDKITNGEKLATIYYNETIKKELIKEKILDAFEITGIKNKEKSIIIDVIL